MIKPNSKEALDLYAKIEDLIGVKDAAPKLYRHYFQIFEKLEFNSLIDIGCGRGDFLLELGKRYPQKEFFGIDKSPQMVQFAKENGVDANVLELKETNQKFDIATAVFDMVNYLTPQEFIGFFEDLKSVVKEGGYFIFDVNTEFGLGEVAVGNFISDSGDRFLAIESFYEGGVYESFFTLFERDKNCYKKEVQTIRQFHYSEEFFKMLGGWELSIKLPMKLYDLESYDKILYVLKKEC